MSSAPTYSPGVMKYVEAAQKLLAERDAALARMKTMKFDTIAVHGLYTVEEALSRNQGAVIEPLYLSRPPRPTPTPTSSRPPWPTSSRPGATRASPTRRPITSNGPWPCSKATRPASTRPACVTASGMSAIAVGRRSLPGQAEGRPGARSTSSPASRSTAAPSSISPSARRRSAAHECRWVQHPWDIQEWKSQIDEDTRFLYMEMPSNPQQSFTDVKALADLAHSWGIPLIVDATCATPALMRPIAHGADIVVHSLTKSITSGGLAIGGALISRKPITTKVVNDHPLFKDELRRVRQVPALPRQRPGRRPGQRHLRPERPADPALEDGPRQRQLPEGRRMAPEAPQGLPGRLSRPAELPPPRGRQEVHEARRFRRRHRAARSTATAIS